MDFLGEAEADPARAIRELLRDIAAMPDDGYLDVDDGGAGWAACELVALALGEPGEMKPSRELRELAGRVGPDEELRRLALLALPRIGAPRRSELASLRHEGGEGLSFEATLMDLGERLEAASAGPQGPARPQAGDLIGLPGEEAGSELVVVQVLGRGEVAVFTGACPDASAARAAAADRPAHRVPTSIARLGRHGLALGRAPVRGDLEGQARYARELSSIDGYRLTTAVAGEPQHVSWEAAREHSAWRSYDAAELRELGLGGAAPARVRSPDEREAEIRQARADSWAAQRATTTPAPFGDVPSLASDLDGYERFSIANHMASFARAAAGDRWWEGPDYLPERRAYDFAGLVAIWRGTWPAEAWPAALGGRMPPRPDGWLLGQALAVAPGLAAAVLRRDAELRLMWDDGPDGGEALRRCVAALLAALA